MSPAESTEIVPSISIHNLVAQRDAALACLRKIREAVEEYQRVGEAIKVGEGYSSAQFSRAAHKWEEPISDGPRYSHRGGGEHLTSPGWLAWASKTVDASLWEHLLALSGIRTYMDAKAKADWDEAIEKNTTPPLTVENAFETFRLLHGKRGEFFERGVLQLFRNLSYDYKSNKPQKFGKRIVVRYLVYNLGSCPEHRACEKLDDLVRAFCVLDSKPEPDHRNGVYSGLTAALCSHDVREWQNGYVRIRVFKNGNGHMYFLRPDLVDQLNLILHKHHPDALPAEAT